MVHIIGITHSRGGTIITEKSHGDEPDDSCISDRERMSNLRHAALNLLMVIELSCEGLLRSLPAEHPGRENVEQIAEARRQLSELMDNAGTD
ncbi:MAG: hypothetical protein MPN21_14215 [Thermoanaerobaculia bacterium]|nr:hypothetical protein [Thermoanaerobaculia bacterium]